MMPERTRRASALWHSPSGMAEPAARPPAPLSRYRQKRNFEVTAEPCSQAEGERYSCTPDLGIYHAVTGPHGDIMIPENRLRAAAERAARGESDLLTEITGLLGKPWDDELEPFRYAGEGAPVRWLHQVV